LEGINTRGDQEPNTEWEINGNLNQMPKSTGNFVATRGGGFRKKLQKNCAPVDSTAQSYGRTKYNEHRGNDGKNWNHGALKAMEK